MESQSPAASNRIADQDAAQPLVEEDDPSRISTVDSEPQSEHEVVPPHARILPPPSSGADFFPLPEVQQAAQTRTQAGADSAGRPTRQSPAQSAASLEEAQALQRALLESLGHSPQPSGQESHASRSPASARRARTPASARRTQADTTSDAETPSSARLARSEAAADDEDEGEAALDASFLTADGLSVRPGECERILEEELAAVVSKALVVGEGKAYLACLFNLRTMPGTKELDEGAREAGKQCGSEAVTVKDAYFCAKFRSFLLAGISRYNKRVGDAALWIKKFVVVAGQIGFRKGAPMSAIARANNYTKFAKAVRNLYAEQDKESGREDASPEVRGRGEKEGEEGRAAAKEDRGGEGDEGVDHKTREQGELDAQEGALAGAGLEAKPEEGEGEEGEGRLRVPRLDLGKLKLPSREGDGKQATGEGAQQKADAGEDKEEEERVEERAGETQQGEEEGKVEGDAAKEKEGASADVEEVAKHGVRQEGAEGLERVGRGEGKKGVDGGDGGTGDGDSREVAQTDGEPPGRKKSVCEIETEDVGRSGTLEILADVGTEPEPECGAVEGTEAAQRAEKPEEEDGAVERAGEEGVEEGSETGRGQEGGQERKKKKKKKKRREGWDEDNPFDARNWIDANAENENPNHDARNGLDAVGNDSRPSEVVLSMPDWVAGSRDRGEGVRLGAGGGEVRGISRGAATGRGAGTEDGRGRRAAGEGPAEERSMAQQMREGAAEGEEVEDGRWAVEEVFPDTRGWSKFDRMVPPSTRARMLFIVGSFIPLFLIANIVLHCRHQDVYLRKWAKYSAVALVIWCCIGALWAVLWAADAEAHAAEGDIRT